MNTPPRPGSPALPSGLAAAEAAQIRRDKELVGKWDTAAVILMVLTVLFAAIPAIGLLACLAVVVVAVICSVLAVMMLAKGFVGRGILMLLFAWLFMPAGVFVANMVGLVVIERMNERIAAKVEQRAAEEAASVAPAAVVPVTKAAEPLKVVTVLEHPEAYLRPLFESWVRDHVSDKQAQVSKVGRPRLIDGETFRWFEVSGHNKASLPITVRYWARLQSSGWPAEVTEDRAFEGALAQRVGEDEARRLVESFGRE